MALIVSAAELRSILQVGNSVTDARLELVLAAAQKAFLRYLLTVDAAGNPIDYTENPGVRLGIQAVALDMFQSQAAPGGQAQGVDFQPLPRVNAYLVQRAVQTYCLDDMAPGSWFA